MRWRTSALLVAVLAIASPVFGQIQITTGVIQGTVADATGAVLAGVTVEAKNIETNITESRVTDAERPFRRAPAPAGTLHRHVPTSGFCHVRAGRRRPDGRPGDQPVAAAQGLHRPGNDHRQRHAGGRDDPERRASTLDERVVGTLPILGRKFEDLLTLTAGVSVVQGPDGDEISFAGQRGVFNNISLDGGDYNNGFFGEQAGGQRAPIDITLDAVKEFQVIATGAPAEFGRTAGGVVNVVTKSGTNTVRGSLFYFQRLEGLTGELSDGSDLEDFHREQIGGTVGGPLKRDKAFYFAAAEGISGDFTQI